MRLEAVSAIVISLDALLSCRSFALSHLEYPAGAMTHVGLEQDAEFGGASHRRVELEVQEQ